MDRGISALRKLNIQESRTPRYAEDIAAGNSDHTTVSDDGSLRLDHSSIFTPASNEGLDEEYSPYSVLNTILWGNADTYQPGYTGG